VDKANQRRITAELCSNLTSDLMHAVQHMPDDWDGHEIRQYLVDKAKTYTSRRKGPWLKDYNNELAVNPNL